MSAASPAKPQQDWTRKRRWPRYTLNLCIRITILRNGKRTSVYGRSIEVAIGGMSCYAPIELLLCEKLDVELIFPDQNRTQLMEAIVRTAASMSAAVRSGILWRSAPMAGAARQPPAVLKAPFKCVCRTRINSGPARVNSCPFMWLVQKKRRSSLENLAFVPCHVKCAVYLNDL